MRDWTRITTFDGLDPTESFILSWEHREGLLRFEVDFVLTKEHPKFRPAAEGEWACFRRGSLIFPNVRSLEGLPEMLAVRPAVDATGANDYGHFDSFTESGPDRFDVTGDFGVFSVVSDKPIVVLTTDVA
jgi:hypothetical protein